MGSNNLNIRKLEDDALEAVSGGWDKGSDETLFCPTCALDMKFKTYFNVTVKYQGKRHNAVKYICTHCCYDFYKLQDMAGNIVYIDQYGNEIPR